MEDEFNGINLWDRVKKVHGDVDFIGTVVDCYHTLSGEPRIIVEADVNPFCGLQHIYRPDQFHPTGETNKPDWA